MVLVNPVGSCSKHVQRLGNISSSNFLSFLFVISFPYSSKRLRQNYFKLSNTAKGEMFRVFLSLDAITL